MSKDPYKYFRGEARELIDGLAKGVLALENGAASRTRVADLLRLAHTLKGAARVVRVTGIATSAHALEEVLAPLRDRDEPASQGVIEELLRLVDAMAAELRTLVDPTAPVAITATEASSAPLETVRIELEEMDRLLEGVTEAVVKINALRREGHAVDHARRLADVLVEQLRPRRTGDGEASSVVPQRAYSLAEELRAAIERLQRALADGVDQTSREVGQVREVANRLRLLPASAIFGALERAARDAGQALGKKVSFRGTGGERRLDAHVLAALRDALLHVVRNAVAHGVELPAERASAGKPEAGEIHLVVERRGNNVAFICHDDGRGIDVEGLRRAAVRAGLMSAAQASTLSIDGVHELLLRGGLSTARTITEVSGRGIGLDVVRDTVSRLHGEIVLKSEAGRGATIELCVPVSLSSLSSLVVEASGVFAAVPLDSVQRTLRLPSSDIVRGPEGDSILCDDGMIPFVTLAGALRQSDVAARDRRHWSTVIVKSASGLAAVGVDRLVGAATTLVRPLPAQLDVEAIVAGASLDAEGNPQLVLDAEGVVAAARAARGDPATDRAKMLPLLVVDDSLTTRMLEQSILESAGYEVELATSAEEGLGKAKLRRYALFVVDVEMPGMDGFEFVSRTRADPTLRETPAILVTSRGSDEDQRRGREAGARGYIVKGDFDQDHLLKVIQGLVG